MAKCHNKRLPVYFKTIHKILFKDQEEKPMVQHVANESIKEIQNVLYKLEVSHKQRELSMMRHSTQWTISLPSVPPSMSWNLYQIDRFLMSLDFSKSVADPNLYSVGDKNLILMTYLERLVVKTSKHWILIFIKNLSMIWSMTECKSTVIDLKKNIDVYSRWDQSTVDWITDVSG